MCSVETGRFEWLVPQKYIDRRCEFSIAVLSYAPKVTVCPKTSVDHAREWVGGLPCHWGLRLKRSHYSLSEASSEWLGDRSEPDNEKHMCSTRHWRSSQLISLAYSLMLSQPFLLSLPLGLYYLLFQSQYLYPQVETYELWDPAGFTFFFVLNRQIRTIMFLGIEKFKEL